jgi:CheY-like chemotaxis protein
LQVVAGTSMGSQLLTLAACAQLPVLALFGSEAEAQQAREQVDGITDCLIKPLRFEDLQHILEQRLLTGNNGVNAEL